MQLSIIVPIYNGEKYIEAFFETLGAQTCRDFEVIFINDGSIDNSLLLLRKLQEKHSEISCAVFSQKNCGVSVARNKGIKYAQGNLLSFCDVDDIIANTYVEYIIRAFSLRETDLIFWKFKRCKSSKATPNKLEKFQFITLNKKKLLNDYLKRIFLTGCWSCAVAKRLVLENDLRYEVSIKYGEDLNYVWKLMLCSNSIGLINNELYYYIKQIGSVMTRFDSRRMDAYYVSQKLIPFVYEKEPNFASIYEKFEGIRIIWSETWQAAALLSKDKFYAFIRQYEIMNVMIKLVNYPSLQVKLSAMIFVASPNLFRICFRVLGRIKL